MRNEKQQYESLRTQLLNDNVFMDGVLAYVQVRNNALCKEALEKILWFAGTAWPVIVGILRFKGYIQ